MDFLATKHKDDLSNTTYKQELSDQLRFLSMGTQIHVKPSRKNSKPKEVGQYFQKEEKAFYSSKNKCLWI